MNFKEKFIAKYRDLICDLWVAGRLIKSDQCSILGEYVNLDLDALWDGYYDPSCPAAGMCVHTLLEMYKISRS
jgi:hypothetical protein